jgi:hypothetical protein
MTSPTATRSTAANLVSSVLDNLQAGSPLQPQISTTLNAALKTQLAAAATTANLPALTGLINAMPAADLAAAKDLSLQAFAQQQIDPMVAGDPAMKTAIDNEIAKLPATGTVGTALNLTSPLSAHPLLKSIVADAQLTSLLAASPALTSPMQARFVTLYNANTGAMPDFWTSLAGDSLAPVVPLIQLTLQLGALTQNNPDLVAKLQAQFHPTSLRDLTKLSADQLVQLMTAENIQVPAAIAATTTPATIAQYANSIVGSLKVAFPTDYVAKSFSASTDATSQAVATFLGASSDFDFAATNIDAYLTAHPAVLAGQSADQVATLTDRLKAAQRVFRVVPDGDVMQILIANGLDSSHAIAATPIGSFVTQYADALGGEDQARQIYAVAANVSSLTSLIIRQAQETVTAGTPRLIQSKKSDSKGSLDTQIPDWQELFGSASTCACSECSAIDGPASYFVSLLEFLHRMPKYNGQTPLQVLLSRRPDLGNLQLTCANADTALPYVDLVNEILESYLAQNGDLAKLSVHDTPSDAATSTLDVTPEYTQTPEAVAAYQKLNDAAIVYPYTLPFDRYLATVRTYLGFLGTSLDQLLYTYGLPVAESGPASASLSANTRLAAEYLRISEPELVLIAGQNFAGTPPSQPAPLSACFGYSGYAAGDTSWEPGIAAVQTFLNKTNLSFNDLLDLIQTRYLNPQRLDRNKAVAIPIPSPPKDPCDVTAMNIKNVRTLLPPLPAFIRLWRKLGWKVSELDYALRAFGEVAGSATGPAVPISPRFILIAAEIEQLRQTLNLSIGETVALWEEIDTDGRASPFMSLFQNKAVLNPPDPGLQLLYQVPLSALPSPLPTTWKYDGAQQLSAFYDNGHLQFVGAMTDSQRDQLLDWANTNDDAIMAVQLLYQQRWYDGIKIAGKPPFVPIPRSLTRQITTPGGGGGTPPQPDPFGPPPLPSIYAVDTINAHLNAILAALRISAADVLAIALDLHYYKNAGDWGDLTLGNLAGLYRHATLARSLGLSVADLIALKKLTGIKPASLASGKDGPVTAPMMQFVTAAQKVTVSSVSVAQLAFLYGVATPSAKGLAPLQATQDAVMAQILVGLQNIAAANAATSDPTGAALGKKLAVLLPAAVQLNAAMGLISGAAVYTAPLAVLPAGVTLPADHVSFIPTATIGDSINVNDTVSLTIAPGGAALPPVSYTVQASDTPESIAAALAGAINNNAAFLPAAVSATASGAMISLSAPAGATWTSTPGSATQSVTFGGNLVCSGAMTYSTLKSLTALSAVADFSAAVTSLYDQAQDILTNSLAFLAAPGPYSASLAALPSSAQLPPGVSYVLTVTVGSATTVNDILSLNMTPVTGAAVTATYQVHAGDTPSSIAAGLAVAINGTAGFGAAGASATALGANINVAGPTAAIGASSWTSTSSLATGTGGPLTLANNLVCAAPMLNSTRTVLAALSPDSAFAAAVAALSAAAWGAATANLISPQPTSTAADRYEYVLGGLLASLTATQSRDLVKQSLSQALSLDAGVVDLLLEGNVSFGWPEGLLRSSIDPTQSAISDFLGGLRAAYTASAGQTVRIDSGVALDGSEPTFTSVTWNGKLLGPTTAAYCFAVTVSSTSPLPAIVPATQVTLKIDNQIVTAPVVFGGSSPPSAWAPVNLTAGQIYDISLTLTDPPVDAAIDLQWRLATAPNASLASIPALAFMPCAANGTYDNLALLYRIAVLINGFAMSAREIASLSLHGADFAGSDPVSGKSVPLSLALLPSASAADVPALFDQWQRLNALYGLKASLPIGNVTLFDVFAAAFASPQPGGEVSSTIAGLIVAATGWSATDIATLVRPQGNLAGFGCTDADFRNEVRLVQLAACIAMGSTLGVAAEQLFAWANPTGVTGGSPYRTVAQDIQHTVKAKYDDATWLQVGKPLNDKLRASSRNALVSYILYDMPDQWSTSKDAPPNADDLYGYFLIDVEMGTCMETSRLVQASAAVQLFVQRCLLNLEPAVPTSTFSGEDVKEWNDWRKNYRVWQAAAEIFLYPENWVEPDLRANKTPFFKDLETTLLQGDVTSGNVEAAYRAYLQSLQQVARLEIAGVYTQDDTDAQMVHVIGRTFTTPYVYFYRRLDTRTYEWSAWEQVGADISSNTLVPVMWNRRLFLFWPIYTETTDPAQNSTSAPSIKTDSGATTVGTPPAAAKSLGIQLAWSEYKDGQWTTKQVTADSLSPSPYQNYSSQLDQSCFVFTAAPRGEDSLVVTSFATAFNLNPLTVIFGGTQDYSIAPLGSFLFDGAQAAVEIDPYPSVDAGEVALFHAVGDLYLYETGQMENVFRYQDVTIKNSIVSLSVIGGGNPDPELVPLLGTAKNISTQTISFPEQQIPAFSINIDDTPPRKGLLFADRRRTYFIANSVAPGKLKDATQSHSVKDDAKGSFYFFNHYHPWVGELIKRLNWKGISYLLQPATQALGDPSGYSFGSYYGPTSNVAQPRPTESVEFGPTASAMVDEQQKGYAKPAGDFAYSIYNWELFFYIPLLIAIRLSQNRQFADAQTWFHYIFNPTQNPVWKNPPNGYADKAPNGYWNFQPLNATDDKETLNAFLQAAAGGNQAKTLTAQLEKWKDSPFDPDLVARLRPTAYQKAVVMKYVDNLIAWGDQLFVQNTRESINEAIQLYILADEILGPKPITIPEPGVVRARTYNELAAQLAKDNNDAFGNAKVTLENAFPFVVSGTASSSGTHNHPLIAPTTTYFCTPPNSTLLGYYDKVADRLYKIRHCMNIQGQVEQLPLFAPPISPGLLIGAAAAGADLSSVLNDISAAVPHYRFTYLMPKALELCGEVRSLGAALLAALEKYDGEGLGLLRARQEVSVLKAVRGVKQLQITEAEDNYEALQATQQVTTARQSYYRSLVNGGLSSYETVQIDAMTLAEELKLVGQIADMSSAGLAIMPQINIGINGAMGSPSVIVSFGGQQTSSAAAAVGRAFAALADISSFVASMSSLMGGWDRRATEWAFQLDTASLELAQIKLQIDAADVRRKIAARDLANQDLQIANAAAVEDTLKSKFTNQELYGWMVNQVSATFFQCYQMAYDLSKRAEACYRFELGLPQSSYIQFGYWDSLKKGLLAGEKLYQDLKRLENAYLDQNKREYEISKSISLLLLDPHALISLKLFGSCRINLPEAYFDMDYPGHYMRRIRSVSLTIPCVTGPYTSVNCTLTLLQSKIRLTNKSGSTGKSYSENPTGSDTRFAYDFAATESIATSTAQNDSGMFEVNFRDERYLPFEGSGVISQWQLSMPADCNAFDFETITDVILNLRYTARSGGETLANAARTAALLPPAAAFPPTSASTAGSSSPAALAKQANLLRHFSLRHEYPTEWYRFLHPSTPSAGVPPSASMQIDLCNNRFPFQYRGKIIKIAQAELIVVLKDRDLAANQATNPIPSPLSFSLSVPASPATIVHLSAALPISANALYASTKTPPIPASAGQGGPKSWILECPDDLSQVFDIFLICQYSTN